MQVNEEEAIIVRAIHGGVQELFLLVPIALNQNIAITMESSSIIGTETAVSKALSLTPLNSWLLKYCLGGSDSDGKAGRLLSDPWHRHMPKAPRMAALPPLVCE